MSLEELLMAPRFELLLFLVDSLKFSRAFITPSETIFYKIATLSLNVSIKDLSNVE